MKQTAKDKLDLLVSAKEFLSINGKEVKIVQWKLDGVIAILEVENYNGDSSQIKRELDKLIPEIDAHKVVENKYTIGYLRRKLIDQIESIESGEIGTDKAKAISTHVQTVVNMTKLELEYKKALAKELTMEGTKFLKG